MRKEEFFEVLGELDDAFVEEAGMFVKGTADGKIRKHSWLKWGAVAACLTIMLALGVPYIYGLKGGLEQGDSLPALKIIEYAGAYYESIDMTNTEILDAYNLPHEITADMVGSSLGAGVGSNGEQIMYQYLPYANIVNAANEPNWERAQRAVYVVADGGGYSFALFCNFIGSDSNTHTEARETFAVYGVGEAEDIASITVGRENVTDLARIQVIFDSIYNSGSMGNADYQDNIFQGMSEEDQQALSIELADSMVEIKIITTGGVVINNLNYYPTINYVYWALNYYQLNSPIQ